MQQVNECFTAIHQTGQYHSPKCQSPDQQQMLKAYQDLNMDVLNGKNWTYQQLKPTTPRS